MIVEPEITRGEQIAKASAYLAAEMLAPPEHPTPAAMVRIDLHEGSLTLRSWEHTNGTGWKYRRFVLCTEPGDQEDALRTVLPALAGRVELQVGTPRPVIER